MPLEADLEETSVDLSQFVPGPGSMGRLTPLPDRLAHRTACGIVAAAMSKTLSTLVLLAALVICAACGDPRDVPSSPFAARCELLCDIDGTMECESSDEQDCLANCNARTAALPPNCGACVLDNSSGHSGECFDDGTGPVCACYRARIGRVSGSCESLCQDIVAPVPVEARCALLCSGTGECEVETEACQANCVARFQPLSPGCSSCLLDNSSRQFEECVDFGDGPECQCRDALFARISSPECESFCQ